MLTFFMSLVGFAFLAFALAMICGVLMGEAGLFVAVFLTVGALFAVLICVYEKLSVVEEKLDKLLKEKEASDQ